MKENKNDDKNRTGHQNFCPSDFDLLNRSCQGDQSAFQELFFRYGRYTAAVIAKTSSGCLEPEDVEELCSDVFWKLWQNRNRLHVEDSTLKSWLGAVARNLTRNALRKQNRMQLQHQRLDLDAPQEGLFHGPSAEETYLKEVNQHALALAITHLDASEQELFLRRYQDRERVTELAKEQGANAKTMSSRLSCICRKLRVIISRKGGFKG